MPPGHTPEPHIHITTSPHPRNHTCDQQNVCGGGGGNGGSGAALCCASLCFASLRCAVFCCA
eukprot:12884522-Prorocentrum_lima.AAC.1